jgi:hypothetical protein
MDEVRAEWARLNEAMEFDRMTETRARAERYVPRQEALEMLGQSHVGKSRGKDIVKQMCDLKRLECVKVHPNGAHWYRPTPKAAEGKE